MSGAALQPVPALPDGVTRSSERRDPGTGWWREPRWQRRLPWLLQATTARAGEDLGLFGQVPARVAHDRWRALREQAALARAVHARQVHGARVLWHEGGRAGLFIADDADAHATAAAGVLLTVAVADCVPIFLVDAARRTVALLHGGWRGVAAGVLDAGLEVLRARAGSVPADLELHCGPAICGACYEVGAEVLGAFGLPADAAKGYLDLRAVIAQQALDRGIARAGVSISTHCTRCGEPDFWSHRGGCSERQLGLLGIRAA